jgi:hypothetical protein
MAAVVRLVTIADVRDEEGADPNRMSVSARHEAELDDGRRVLLLDDRGWTSVLRGAGVEEFADVWATTSAREIESTTRMVVGPDEPFGERTWEDMEADHWAAMAEVLREHGVVADAQELKQLPHEVVLSDRLRARLGTA